MLHLIDRLFVFELAEPLHAPVVEHASVQKILIDGGEFVLQGLVEKLQNFRVALHVGPLLFCAWNCARIVSPKPSRKESIGRQSKAPQRWSVRWRSFRPRIRGRQGRT